MPTLETRALIPVPREQSEQVVASSELEAYFLHVGLIHPTRVPKRIDLGKYKPVMDNLYINSQEAFDLPEDARTSMLQDIDSRGEPVNDVVSRLRERTKELINQKVPGERSVTVYHDPEDDTIKTSDVNFGEKDQVNTKIIDLYTSGKMPLFGVHTHPLDTLFSPQDFYSMILDIGDGEGFMKGQVVLLPNSQILALSTSDTPHLNSDEAEELVDQGLKTLHNASSGRIAVLHNRLINVEKFVSKFHVGAFDDVMKKCVAIENRMKAGEFDEKEALRLIDLERDMYAQSSNSEKIRHTRVRNKTWKNYYDLVNKETNRVLIDFARSIDVQLYFSTDRKNFRAFTV